MKKNSLSLGLSAIRIIEYIGLFIISIATLVAGFQEILRMFTSQLVTLGDLLLLFIYLEVIAMVAIYLESHKLPVRLPIYIAIVALARYVILDVKEMTEWRVLAVAAGILLLALAVLVLRYGDIRFPYPYGSAKSFNRTDAQSTSDKE